MLEVKGLHAFYGESHVLHDLNLTVPSGGRVALIGRNGAGKSTLLKSLMGAGPTTQGDIWWEGRSLGTTAPHRRARLGIAFVPEDRRILANLTVFENLKMARNHALSRPMATPEETLEQFPLLEPLKERLGGVLSGGQQQLLALARAAISNPRLLLLDEPTEGLAPVIVESMVDDVQRICGSGCALLVCEQSLWFSRRCTDYVHVIDSGHLVFSGNWKEFDEAKGIRERHLGV